MILLFIRAAGLALGYGALVAAGAGLALEWQRPHLAFFWTFGMIFAGAFVLAVWLAGRIRDDEHPGRWTR